MQYFRKEGDFVLVLRKGFNYSQDGPGNRLVYHLQGCNFSCKWCSNADSIPTENTKAKNQSPNDVFDEILRSRMMFFDGGGVTFTGGECTLWHCELLPLFKRLRENNIGVAIETNASSVHLPELSEYVDHLIIDLKHYDDAEHKKWVGASLEQTKKNIEFFLSSGREIHIRIPVIGGVNDNPRGFAEYFRRFDTSNADFEFLAYHEYGKDKWQGKYEMKNAFVSAETMAEFKKIFIENGFKVTKT